MDATVKCPCELPKSGRRIYPCSRVGSPMTPVWCKLYDTNPNHRRAFDGNYGPGQQGKKPAQPDTPPVPQEGPGTELLKMLDKPVKILGFLLRINMDDCKCPAYARQMNAWGVDGCRKRLDEIVGHLEATAKQTKRMPFNRLAAKALVEMAIERAEKKERELAADNAKQL